MIIDTTNRKKVGGIFVPKMKGESQSPFSFVRKDNKLQ